MSLAASQRQPILRAVPSDVSVFAAIARPLRLTLRLLFPVRRRIGTEDVAGVAHATATYFCFGVTLVQPRGHWAPGNPVAAQVVSKLA